MRRNRGLLLVGEFEGASDRRDREVARSFEFSEGARSLGCGGALPNVAMDGPAASGKSTVARETARRLGLLYVDTGAMYRAVAAEALRRGIAPDDSRSLAELAAGVYVEIEPRERSVSKVLVHGRDVTGDLRTPEVDRIVSTISAIPEVRRRLTALQRKLAARGGVVLEGRDIGTQVLPDAPLKFYITASLAERARRRHEDQAIKGPAPSLETVARELEMRDVADSTRAVAPLEAAGDAIVIDTTNLPVEAVVEAVVEYCRALGLGEE